MALEVGTDLYGTKHNILVQCAHAPSLYEFKQVVEAQFDVKARSCRPAGYPDEPFRVETMQIFGDRGMWEDLVQDQQLRPGSQVWIFQPESVWHSDAQGVIPGAKQGATWVPKPGSPGRTRGDGNTGVPPTLVEKMTATFHQIDGNGKGYLMREDMDRAFDRAGIQFTDYQGAFQSGDYNRSGHITWDEWQRFAIEHDSVVDALFFRMQDAGTQPQYTAPPPAQVVSRQPDYPGQPVPYNPVPATTYSQPPDYSGYQYQPPAPQQQYSAPQQQYSAPQQQPAAAPPKSYEQEVAEFMDQTSPQRLAQGSPSRMPSQDYMNKAYAQSGAQAPGQGSPQRGAPPQQYGSQPQQYGSQPQQYSSQPQQYSSQPQTAPAPAGYSVAPAPSYGQGYQAYGPSPERQRAQGAYEAARSRADQARLEKEGAEKDERHAWDRLYQTPQ